MGTSGDRVSQSFNMENIQIRNGRPSSYDIGTPNGDYYKLYAPTWNNYWDLTSQKLNSIEQESLDKAILHFENL